MDLLYSILFVSYASYAFNRKSVAFSMPSLKKDGLDTSHAGLISSSQNAAFAISKFLAGVLSDRINPYFMYTVGLIISGVATILFSSSSSIAAFCCLWCLNGIAQGCGWPSLAKILRQRAPPFKFGTLWSVLASSQNVSGSLGPFVSAFIILHYGWRWNVFFTGFVTLLLCLVFLLCLPFLSEASNAQVEKISPSKNKTAETTISDLFQDPFIWVLSMCFMVVFCARTTTIDWGQLYLIEEKKHSQYVASAFTSSVEIGGFIGRLAGGYLTDWVIRRNISKQNSTHSRPGLRLSVAIIFLLGSAVSIFLFRFAVFESSSSLWITFIGTIMGMCYYGPIAIFGIVASESVPSHLSGSSNAIVALFGNIGATISGLPFSYVAKHYNWSAVFLLLEILVVGVLMLLVKCRKLTPDIGKKEKSK